MSTAVETLFSIFDTSSILLRKELDVTYLEALIETGDNLFEGAILQHGLHTSTSERLQTEYNTYQDSSYMSEDIRKAFQLCLLKGMKEGIQAHHEMTPDAVGLFISYLFSRFFEGKKQISILDPAAGTANLLTTIFNTRDQDTAVSGYAVEVDEVLLRLAYVNANLQKHAIEFFNQDGLAPLYIDPVDAVVCDLPIGYYPNEDRAKEFSLRAENGMSFSHHLFMEQSMKYTKEGGYLFFLIPNSLFESEQAQKLHTFLQETCYVQGVMKLPVSMFANEKQAKSIFILQKKGDYVNPPKQAMLAELPKFTNRTGMEQIMAQITAWFQDNKQAK